MMKKLVDDFLSESHTHTVRLHWMHVAVAHIRIISYFSNFSDYDFMSSLPLYVMKQLNNLNRASEDREGEKETYRLAKR